MVIWFLDKKKVLNKRELPDDIVRNLDIIQPLIVVYNNEFLVIPSGEWFFEKKDYYISKAVTILNEVEEMFDLKPTRSKWSLIGKISPWFILLISISLVLYFLSEMYLAWVAVCLYTALGVIIGTEICITYKNKIIYFIVLTCLAILCEKEILDEEYTSKT